VVERVVLELAAEWQLPLASEQLCKNCAIVHCILSSPLSC
jgi:hypothetical protein